MATPPTPNQVKPLGLPRLTGNPQSDYPTLIEYLHSLYRVISNNYISTADVGPTVQPTTAMLNALSPLVPAADKLPYTTSATEAALTPFTAFARTILDDTDSATVRTTLGLGALAQLNSVATINIDDDAVTYAKLQNLSTNNIVLGRTTAGAGNVEEVPFSSLVSGLDHASLSNLNSSSYSHLTSTEKYEVLSQMSTSLVSGCSLSINADPTKFNIASGRLRFVDSYTDPVNPVVNEISYAGSTGISVTNLATQDSTYIAIDSAGAIYQTATKPVDGDLRDRVALGVLVHTNRTSITAADSTTEVLAVDVSAALSDVSVAIGPVNGGNVFSGNATSGLKIDKTAGTLTMAGINWRNSAKSPNMIVTPASTGANFYATWRNGVGGWHTELHSAIQPGYYDDGTGGTGHPSGVVNTNKWQLIKIYYLPNSQIAGIEYGQTYYNSEAEAEANKSDATLQNPALASVPFRCWLLVRGGATNLRLTSDAVFLDAGKFGSLTSGSATGSSITTMQGSYDNSTQPQILTDATRGAVQVKRGSAADTDKVFEILNGAGSSVASVTGEGVITATSFVGNASTASNLSGTPALPNGTTATTQAIGTSTDVLATCKFVMDNSGGSIGFPLAIAFLGI